MLPRQITHQNIYRLLIAGFSLVILMLLAAAIVGLRNIQSIQENASNLVHEQDTTRHLVDELRSREKSLAEVFSILARDPDSVDYAGIMSQLAGADRDIERISAEGAHTPQSALWTSLRETSAAFSGEAATNSIVSPSRTRWSECCGESGSRSTSSSLRRERFLPIARVAMPRRRSHQSALPRRPRTAATAPICPIVSIEGYPRVSVFAEVGDAHAQRSFDHHDLTGAAQHAADVDVDVLARRPHRFDHAALFEAQDFARRHDAAVELDFDLHRDISQRSNFLLRIHRRTSELS